MKSTAHATLKTKVMLVTPQTAQKWLDECNTENRPLNADRIASFKADILSGCWVLTHQGIAFDTRGVRIDGQTRLAAIVAANKSVKMMVTFGLPVEQHSESSTITMKTMDAVDRGQKRSTAQQLRLSHGYGNSAHVAAAAKTVRDLCIGGNGSNMSTAQTLHVLSIFGKDIEAVLAVTWPKSHQRASIYGTLAFCRSTCPHKLDDFAWSLATMTNVQRGSPVLALNRWNANNGSANTSSSQRMQFCRVVASCVKKFIENEQIDKVAGSEEALDWFRMKMKSRVSQVIEVCGR